MTQTVIPALDLTTISACKACPKLGKDHVPACGTPLADLMIIGQSPGEDEVRTREPFTGPAGHLLKNMLTLLLLDRTECYITNVVKCRPPNNRASERDEKVNCHQAWLKDEIKIVNPPVLLLLGRDAHEIVLPSKYPFTNKSVVRTKKRSYVSLYHPAYWLRRSTGSGKFLDGAAVVQEELEYWRSQA